MPVWRCKDSGERRAKRREEMEEREREEREWEERKRKELWRRRPPAGMGKWEGLESESGSLGGRLARALAGEEGPEARSSLMHALGEVFRWWKIDRKTQQPKWLMEEAAPGLLALSQASGPPRSGALRLLCDAADLYTDVGDALRAAWAADPEILAYCLYQEPPDAGLVQDVRKFTRHVRPRLPELRAVLDALAASFRRFRQNPPPLATNHDLYLCYEPLCDILCGEHLFPLEVVLGDEELCREVAAYLAQERITYPVLAVKLLSAVEAGDARLCRFLRLGGAETGVQEIRLGSQEWADSVAGLLEAGAVGRETRALRAQLFRDAGLGEALACRRSVRVFPSYEEALEKSYTAALSLRLITTRLPSLPTNLHSLPTRLASFTTTDLHFLNF